jgi:hypothetical protein
MLATGPTNVRILPCSFTHACNLSKHFIFVTITNAIKGNAGKSQQKQCNPGWCWPHRQLAPRSDAQRRPTVSSAACGSPAYNTLRITHSRSLSSSLSPAVAYITHTAIACICRGHRDWHCQCLTCPCCCQHCIHMLLHADHSLTTHCGSLMHCRCHPLCHLLPLTSHCHGMHLSRSSRLALAMLHVHALPCPCLPCHCLALQRSHMLTMPMLTMSMLTMLLSSAVTNCRLHGTAMVMHIYRSGNEEDPRLYALSAKRKAHAGAPTKRSLLNDIVSATTEQGPTGTTAA